VDQYNYRDIIIVKEKNSPKTLMDLKNLMSHVVRPVNPTTTGELPAKELAQLSAPELAQLSEEDLLQIIGGVHEIGVRGELDLLGIGYIVVDID
jgi:hypothetical protein